MTLDSFFSTCDFHDSLRSNISLNEDRIVMTVDFCSWRQNDYVVAFNYCDDLNDGYYQIRFRARSARLERGRFN